MNMMKYTENTLNIITTKSYKGIGRAWIIKYLSGNESVEHIITLINSNSKQDKVITINDFIQTRNQIKELINSLGIL